MIWNVFNICHTRDVDTLVVVNHKGVEKPRLFDVRTAPGANGFEDAIGQDLTPLAEAYMSTLNPNTYIPAKGLNGETAAIQGRIEQLSRESDSDSAGPTMLREMTWFINKMFEGHKHSLMPATNEEVRERQPRPSQQAILDQADMAGDFEPKKLRSFCKKETSPKVNHPRNISIYPPKIKSDYSRVMYPLSDLVKLISAHGKLDAYMFGKTPSAMAQAIHLAFRDAEDIIEGDASRQDGHINRKCRQFERKVLEAVFNIEFVEWVVQVHEATFGRKGRTTQGRYYYKQGYTRGSGSPDTSLFNTLWMLFLYFRAFRNTGLSRDSAWEHLNKFARAGGDDSLITKLNKDVLSRACEEGGQVMKLNRVMSGEPVNFFGRWYLPQAGLDSCVDVMRMLSKFCVSATPVIDPMSKLREKVSALAMTDRNSPLAQDLIDHYLRLGGQLLKDPTILQQCSWWCQWGGDVQFPNATVNWYWRTVPKTVYEDELRRQLEQMTQLEDFLYMDPVVEEGSILRFAEDYIIDVGTTILYIEKIGEEQPNQPETPPSTQPEEQSKGKEPESINLDTSSESEDEVESKTQVSKPPPPPPLPRLIKCTKCKMKLRTKEGLTSHLIAKHPLEKGFDRVDTRNSNNNNNKINSNNNHVSTRKGIANTNKSDKVGRPHSTRDVPGQSRPSDNEQSTGSNRARRRANRASGASTRTHNHQQDPGGRPRALHSSNVTRALVKTAQPDKG
jgi:hypothetical protein